MDTLTKEQALSAIKAIENLQTKLRHFFHPSYASNSKGWYIYNQSTGKILYNCVSMEHAEEIFKYFKKGKTELPEQVLLTPEGETYFKDYEF